MQVLILFYLLFYFYFFYLLLFLLTFFFTFYNVAFFFFFFFHFCSLIRLILVFLSHFQSTVFHLLAATDYIAVISSSAATLSLFSVSSGALVFHQPILGHWKGLPKKISIGSAEISPWSPCGVCIFLADAENARVWIAALEFRGSEEERLQIHQLQARDSQFKRFAVYPVNSRVFFHNYFPLFYFFVWFAVTTKS